MSIKIIIATHKESWMPDDPLYLPLHVGKKNKQSIGYQGDDTGNNISEKNPYYSELTGMYWAWKNLDTEYIGLAHYRRHFCFKKKKSSYDSVITLVEVKNILRKSNVILPKKRKYYIETMFSHYANTHDANHLILTKEILSIQCPDYVRTFDLVMGKRSAHMFNMLIMKRDIFAAYCGWLFPILQELEKRIDYSNLPPFEARLFGRVSELLLDVWITQNNISYKELDWVHLGKVNWTKKIKSFLLAKVGKKKYDGSF